MYGSCKRACGVFCQASPWKETAPVRLNQYTLKTRRKDTLSLLSHNPMAAALASRWNPRRFVLLFSFFARSTTLITQCYPESLDAVGRSNDTQHAVRPLNWKRHSGATVAATSDAAQFTCMLLIVSPAPFLGMVAAVFTCSTADTITSCSSPATWNKTITRGQS